MTTGDLLADLAALDHDGRQHMLMPCMAIACGADFLTLPTGSVTLTSRLTTCPDCLDRYGGIDGLRAECARQQGHQQKGSP